MIGDARIAVEAYNEEEQRKMERSVRVKWKVRKFNEMKIEYSHRSDKIQLFCRKSVYGILQHFPSFMLNFWKISQ